VYGMDIATNDLAQVQRYLGEHGAPAQYTLAPGLKSLPVKGGARLSWQGHPVAMVCFDLTKGRTLWMFVMNEIAFRDGSGPAQVPSISTLRGLRTMTWSESGQIYLIAVPAEAESSDTLRKLLGAAKTVG